MLKGYFSSGTIRAGRGDGVATSWQNNSVICKKSFWTEENTNIFNEEGFEKVTDGKITFSIEMRREFLIARILSLDIELVPVPKLAEIMHQVNEIYNETLCNTQINCKLSIFLDKRSSKKIVFF